ncbi:MAG: VOC family protein [Azospirillaceae bacterium]
MRLYGVRLFVDDIAAARTFYGGTLGLPVAWDMAEMDAVGYAVGESVIIVEREAPDGPYAGLIGRFAGVSLMVGDIEATYRDLSAKGVVFTDPPEKQPWGGTLAHFRDPAGNTLTLLG